MLYISDKGCANKVIICLIVGIVILSKPTLVLFLRDFVISHISIGVMGDKKNELIGDDC